MTLCSLLLIRCGFVPKFISSADSDCRIVPSSSFISELCDRMPSCVVVIGLLLVAVGTDASWPARGGGLGRHFFANATIGPISNESVRQAWNFTSKLPTVETNIIVSNGLVVLTTCEMGSWSKDAVVVSLDARTGVQVGKTRIGPCGSGGGPYSRWATVDQAVEDEGVQTPD